MAGKAGNSMAPFGRTDSPWKVCSTPTFARVCSSCPTGRSATSGISRAARSTAGPTPLASSSPAVASAPADRMTSSASRRHSSPVVVSVYATPTARPPSKRTRVTLACVRSVKLGRPFTGSTKTLPELMRRPAALMVHSLHATEPRSPASPRSRARSGAKPAALNRSMTASSTLESMPAVLALNSFPYSPRVEYAASTSSKAPRTAASSHAGPHSAYCDNAPRTQKPRL
mmetsp:Transcript_22963/g.74033  ORF Transcript_22963/g.74033 Transcript_22963/m.74033 type:complete len:229 (-) Transcript_22963:441-1127(-)